MNHSFGLQEATAIVPCLADLRVAVLSASPYFAETTVSNHGYDVVDYSALNPELRHKVLLPILGAPDGTVLEGGNLRLRLAEGTFWIDYYETPLPVAPPTYPAILRRQLPALIARMPDDDPMLLEFQSVITAFECLPGQEERDPDLIAERLREQVFAQRRPAAVVRASALARNAVAAAITEINGGVGEPASFDFLEQLLE